MLISHIAMYIEIEYVYRREPLQSCSQKYYGNGRAPIGCVFFQLTSAHDTKFHEITHPTTTTPTTTAKR